MQKSFLLFAGLLSVASPSRARADVSCEDAADLAHAKRDKGQLLEARSLLRVCSAPACPTTQKACSEGLRELGGRLPSVVLSAQDAAGVAVVDTKAFVDRMEVSSKLDGLEIALNPGPHTVAFVLPDGTRAETQVVLQEGERRHVVTGSFAPPTAQAVTPPLAKPEPPPASPQPAPASHTSPIRTLGLVAGGAGLAGVVVGSIFGAEALSTRSAHCNANDVCSANGATTAYNQGTVSTAAFVTGGILLAAGVTMFVLAPTERGSNATQARVSLVPVLGPSTGGVQLAGRW